MLVSGGGGGGGVIMWGRGRGRSDHVGEWGRGRGRRGRGGGDAVQSELRGCVVELACHGALDMCWAQWLVATVCGNVLQ